MIEDGAPGSQADSETPSRDRRKLGLIIGKFMPPHRGHEYLARFALSFVDDLWIFVCSLPHETIPGTVRYEWMRELFPRAKVIHIHEVNPAANREQEGAQKIWANAVLPYLPRKPDYIFASESYGWDFAKELGAVFVPVDPSRDQFPISGSELRSHPFRYWHFIPWVVRPYFVREILIGTGPELDSSHEIILKSTALLLGTLYIPVYESFYQGFASTDSGPRSPEIVVPAQAALIRALKTQARCFLLRSTRELESGALGRPDLLIRLGNAPETDLVSSVPRITLSASVETAPHLIRDALMERYRTLF